MPSADRLTFGRVSTTYVIPRGTPAQDDVRRRGDAALREHLFTVLGPALARTLPQGDPTVWIIRRLDLDFPLPIEQHSLSRLGEAWASEVSRGLVRTLRAGDDVVRFPNRAAFLAQYLYDVAHGRDSGCWYYDMFDSLSALPVGAKIREALVREPEDALAALIELARAQRLAAVLAALHESGARAIYEAAFPVAASLLTPSPRMIEMLLSLFEREATAREALRLAVTMCVQAGDRVAPADIRAHVDRLIEFAAMLGSLDEPWRLVELLLDGNLAGAARLAPRSIETLQFWAQLAEARPDVVTCAASTVASSAVKTGDSIASAFAGLAMLLPYVESRSSVMRALIAVYCAGTRRVLRDPVIRLFIGKRRRPRFRRTARRAVRGYVVRRSKEVLAKFASHLFGFAGSSPGYLRANFLEGAGNLRFKDDTIVVDLPPVPLEVILNLTGMHDRRFAVPWLPGKTIVLRLGGRQ